jgi:hypothetical protein
MSRKHVGSSIDDFLRKEEVFEEAQAHAIKEVIAWQLAKAMKKKRPSCSKPAVPKSIAFSIRNTTSPCRACSAPPLWLITGS